MKKLKSVGTALLASLGVIGIIAFLFCFHNLRLWYYCYKTNEPGDYFSYVEQLAHYASEDELAARLANGVPLLNHSIDYGLCIALGVKDTEKSHRLLEAMLETKREGDAIAALAYARKYDQNLLFKRYEGTRWINYVFFYEFEAGRDDQIEAMNEVLTRNDKYVSAPMKERVRAKDFTDIHEVRLK
jgi:hypothetical protein